MADQRWPQLARTATALAISPLLLAQGWWVRRRTPPLPEAPGPRAGTCGHGPPLRLLLTGDSAAAGVGASTQHDALLGQIVARLEPSNRVRWSLEAETGATTSATIDRLAALEPQRFDVAVTSLGVNDVTAGRTLERWLRSQRKLRTLLRARFGVDQIVVSGLPPVRYFPALPQPLRWALGQRAEQFDRALRKSLLADTRTSFVGIDFPADVGMMAADGYHPGPEIYARWAGEIATVILCTRHWAEPASAPLD